MDVKKIEENQELYVISSPSVEKKLNPKKSSFWNIDKQMIRFKYHFFLYIGANAAVLTYIPIIARNQIGLTATSLAAILTTQQFITILSKPLIGYIVDYFNKLKLMIILLIITQTILYFLLLEIPPISSRLSKPSQFQVDFSIGNISNYKAVVISFKTEHQDDCESHFERDLRSTKEGNSTIKVNEIMNNIICIGSYNETTMHCFRTVPGLENVATIYLEANADFCCSTYQYYEDVPFNTSQITDSKRILTLSSMKPSRGSSDSPFTCSLEFQKSDWSSDSDAPSVMSDFQTSEFWLFAVIYSIASTCTNSAFTLGDTACCESIQKFGADFGRQRLFGAIGWGIIAPLSGLLCDLTGGYFSAFMVMALMQSLAIWNISKMDMVKPHFSQNILKDIGTVLKSIQFLTFQFGVFMNGMGAGIMWFYAVWFLTSLGGSKFLCGLVQYVQCFVGEIPFMFFSGFFINRMGHFNLLSASLMCYTFRFIWYSYLHNPWLVLPVECMHSFTYGTYYPTVASFGKESAKPGTEATTQSILFSTHEGLGAGLGCVLAGIGFDHLGGHRTFFYTGIFCFCAFLLTVFNTFVNKKRRKGFAVSPDILKK